MNRTPELIAALRADILAAAPAARPSMIGQLAALQAEMLAQLSMTKLLEPPPPEVAPAEEDRLLRAEEAARLLGQKVQWVYAHAHELPRVPLGGRSVRFSLKGLHRLLARRAT
ncbi:MAG TPA: helix-turn-helix domain-containing protein [Thermoanaerobaculia bacterium]|nr:helix-turn-helix domain-containing protein [Thermoanaerobaculia bacterium]